MNCNEYRQAIDENPAFDGGASHVSECAECQAYRKQMLALDETIARALAVDVPALRMPDLSEVDSAGVVALDSRRGSLPTWFAMAAAVVVAAVLGFRMLGTDIVYDSLADEIIAHLDHEPAALVVTDRAVSDRRLARVVTADVAELNVGAGLITYAQTCIINGKDVPHLVIQGERGPVTILLMPQEEISSAVDLSGDNIRGVLLPVGSGSIAIIGERDEQLEPIRENIVNSVMWDT